MNQKTKKRIKIGVIITSILIILMNIIAYFHAYKFTHFDTSENLRTSQPKELSIFQKLKALTFGVNNPRPINSNFPKRAYNVVKLQSNKQIECWMIKTDSAKGTVAMFHGFSSNKSSLLNKSEIFIEMGYNTILVDFMGSGGSEGNQTTLGFYEAEEVKSVVDYLKSQGDSTIILFGSSMGAVAIMKSCADYHLSINSIIIECPFGSMLTTVQSRFRNMGVPSFPMANLLVFWGGLQNGFNAYHHNPEEYAKSIHCPTLLFYGLQDQNVSKKEIDQIFQNLSGKKYLKSFPNAGHGDYLKNYETAWKNEVQTFLNPK